MNTRSTVSRCSIPYCNTIKPGDGVSLHSLPAEPGLRSFWLRALLEETGQNIFREEDQICSKHFTSDSFESVKGLIVLKAEAIPFRSYVNHETPTCSKKSRLEESSSESKRCQKRSSVWEYFTQFNETTANCRLCTKDFKFVGGTSNLREHLKRIHPGLIDSENSTAKDTIELISTNTASNSSSPHVSICADSDRNDIFKEQQSKWTLKKPSTTKNSNLSSKEKEDFDMSLVKMLVCDYQPLGMVCDSGFQTFIKKLQPSYTLPSEEMISSEILPSIYDKIKIQLREIVGEVSHVAISTDVWTHDNQYQYLTFTTHFVYEGQMVNACIASRKLSGSNAVSCIKSLFDSILYEWNIHQKVVCVVSDCENVIRAIISDLFPMRTQTCIAYTLNACLKESLYSNDVVKRFLNKCSNIDNNFKQEKNSENTLNQRSVAFPQNNAKKNDEDWQIIRIMLEKLLQRRNTVMIAETIDEEEWCAIGEFVSILKLVENFTTEISSKKYPPVSSVIPLTRCLRYAIETRQILSGIGKSFQLSLASVLSQRLGGFETDMICAKATFLDPRFKKEGFSSLVNAEKIQEEIINELSSMMSQIGSLDEPNLESRSTDEIDIWAHFDRKVAQLKSSKTPKDHAEIMIKHYLEVPIIPRSQDPFEYWDLSKDVFPELYKLHLKYCCCSATSISPKVLFTKQGRNINIRRSRLPDKSLDKIVFLNGNNLFMN